MEHLGEADCRANFRRFVCREADDSSGWPAVWLGDGWVLL